MHVVIVGDGAGRYLLAFLLRGFGDDRRPLVSGRKSILLALLSKTAYDVGSSNGVGCW